MSKPNATKRVNYKAAAEKLAGCVIWALKFMKAPGSGAMYDPKTGEMKSWQHDFMDALDMIGYRVDREAYFDARSKTKAKGKR